MKLAVSLPASFLTVAICVVRGGDWTSRVKDRAAIEHVYYEHRTGSKAPFEQALPPSQLEQMVKLDLKKEAMLRRVYNYELQPGEIETEVQRINSTTRAPEMLGEIKSALDNDAARFADAMARPILVERRLQEKFQNDGSLHAAARAEAEKLRERALALEKADMRIDLLKTAKDANPNEATWQLAARSEAEKSETAGQNPPVASAPVTADMKSDNYSIQATVQHAQPMTASEKKDEKSYFEDLDPELQQVLRVQLNKPGDISAVIETQTAFLLFGAKEKTNKILSAVSVTIPKRSYDEWIAHQPD